MDEAILNERTAIRSISSAIESLDHQQQQAAQVAVGILEMCWNRYSQKNQVVTCARRALTLYKAVTEKECKDSLFKV